MGGKRLIDLEMDRDCKHKNTANDGELLNLSFFCIN